jgi:hypothetical protein
MVTVPRSGRGHRAARAPTVARWRARHRRDDGSMAMPSSLQPPGWQRGGVGQVQGGEGSLERRVDNGEAKATVGDGVPSLVGSSGGHR